MEVTGFRAIGPGSAVELPRSVEDAYAAILDFVRAGMDVMGVAKRAGMLGYGDQIDEFDEPLRAAGYCQIVATREANLSSRIGQGAKPLSTTIIYVVAGPIQGALKQIVVPRNLAERLSGRTTAPKVHGTVG